MLHPETFRWKTFTNFGILNTVSKRFIGIFFQWKTIPYQDFILTKTYSWAVLLLQVDVNNACSIFHQQLFQDSELPGGKKIQTQKTSRFPVKCSYVTVVKLAIATPAYLWKDGLFFCLKRTLHSKKDYKIIPDYRGRSNSPYDLLCNEPRLSTCVAPPDNIHVQWFTDHNQDEKRKENGEKLFE